MRYKLFFQFFLLLILPVCAVQTSCANKPHAAAALPETYQNPLPVPVADPFVLYEGGVYYLYGTDERGSSKGFPVYTSTNLADWTDRGFAFRASDKTWSKVNFWSPEVVRVGGAYYMYFSASPNTVPNVWPFNMYLCIAKSSSPLGPFEEIKSPFYRPSGKDEAIDSNVFLDDDGKAYLYFVYVTHGCNEIRGVKLKDNLVEMDGEPTLCVQPVEDWENHPWEGHRVAEGAFMLKHNGYYYLTYTANHFLDPDYCIGYATSKSPLGPWEKYKGNPVLKRSDFIYGPGNGMMVPSPDGAEYFMVYHIHYNTTQAGPRQLAIDRIRFESRPDGPDILFVDGPTHTPQPLPSGAK
jgi:beta-xylosidase